MRLCLSSLAFLSLFSSTVLADVDSASDPITGERLTIEAPGEASTLGDYLAGLSAAQAGDYDAAAEFFARFLRAKEVSGELLQYGFSLAAAAGRFEDADLFAERMVQADPSQGSARLVLASAAVVAGDWVTAQQHIEAIEAEGLGRLIRPFMLAWVQFGAGEEDTALATLDALAQDEAVAGLAKLHRALILDLSGDEEAAMTGYQALFVDDAKPSLRSVMLAANFYARQGRGEEAEALYRRALSDQGGDAPLLEAALEALKAGEPEPLVASAADGMAEVTQELAQALISDGQAESAYLQLRVALRLKPSFDLAWLTLADLQQQGGQLTKAAEAYQQVPADSLFSWSARLSLADVLRQDERFDEAIQLYEALAAERPASIDALYSLGNLHRAQSNFDLAAKAYEQALERSGEPKQQDWPLYYFRGICYERIGEWAKAEHDFLLALDLEPEQPQVMNYLAYSWVEQGLNLERAKKMLERAVELSPQDGFIIDSLGWVLYRTGDFEGAVVQLERAVQLEPVNAVINDHLGDAYWRVGRTREARVQWQRALSLAPDPELDAAEVQGKLDQGLPPAN